MKGPVSPNEMRASDVTFKNRAQHTLAAKLTLPDDHAPRHFALFAHCFTCSKDFHPVRHISNTLTASGFGVLSFDFTGLGESEGEFSDTSFSSNLEDLISAADFLKENFKPPSLIIGHSLGGAAVIFAASQLSSVKAIATIAAPADVAHVQHLLAEEIETIQEEGEAIVSLEGRKFKVKRSFLRDLENHRLLNAVKNLRKPILIMHSPQDRTVGIEHAEDIYTAAFHPKSFISLDGANHLLTNKRDAKYAGRVIAAWSSYYLPDLDS